MADGAPNIRAGAFLTPPESTYILPFSTIGSNLTARSRSIACLRTFALLLVTYWLALAYLLNLGLPYFATENECVCVYSFEEKEQEDLPNL